jgi:3-hydroxyacyl-[acyl-carrier-protein] dehydratase
MPLDVNRIREILPHRYPFLLLDRILTHDDNSLKAIKNVSINEPFFEGHYPHMPVMPGVLLLEAMAQAAAAMVSLSLDAKASSERVYLFAGADKVRFRRPVVPGDVLVLESSLSRRVRNIWKCQTKASVEGLAACSAELMFTYRNVDEPVGNGK